MTEKKRYLMALDAGTGAGRCFMISLDGKHIVKSYREWSYQFPPEAQPGGMEFDPESFWKIFSELTQETLAKSGVKPDQVVGVSSTSQREGVVFLDKEGKELYAGPNMDMRIPADGGALLFQCGEEIYQATGHWPMPIFAPYRLLWMRERKPELYERISTVLLINDWILFRLSGERASEPSNGVETLLLDQRTKQWSKGLIDKLGLDANIFPKVLDSGSLLGTITAQSAKETGLAQGTPVIMGGADSQCGVLGCGAINDGDIGCVMGSFAPLQMVIPEPMVAADYRVWSGCHAVPGKWIIESTAFESGQVFRWVRDVYYSGEGESIFSQMDMDAGDSPIGSKGILSYLGPRMSIPNYREASWFLPGGFIMPLPALPGMVTRGDFARAVLENIAFAIRGNQERLADVSNREVARLRVCGGLSQSDTLVQILADLLKMPIMVPSCPEGSSMGAAICAGVGSGVYSSFAEGVDALIHWKAEMTPTTESSKEYQAAYEKWCAQVPKMYGFKEWSV